MKVLALSIVRHTRNYEAMVQFYRDTLMMKFVDSWDEPGNRGTLLSPGEKVSATVIEVLELGDEAKPDTRPENVVLSIEVENVDDWHDQLVGKGTVIARGLEDAPWEHRSFGVNDPDGFRIWFYQDVREKLA